MHNIYTHKSKNIDAIIATVDYEAFFASTESSFMLILLENASLLSNDTLSLMKSRNGGRNRNDDNNNAPILLFQTSRKGRNLLLAWVPLLFHFKQFWRKYNKS